mgnify:CR=1 FL=1
MLSGFSYTSRVTFFSNLASKAIIFDSSSKNASTKVADNCIL